MKNRTSAPPRLCDSAFDSDAFAGLILAGGEGRRFGGPKAWATLPDGTTFLQACASTLIEVGAVRVAATLPPDSLDPNIPGLKALRLEDHGLDMFGSVRAGLWHLIQCEDWRWLVVLPVDHPLVCPDTVRALVAAAQTAVVPVYRGKRGHPIVLEREIAVSIVCGDLTGPTMREVLKSVASADLEVEDGGVVANCNTPEALSEALKASNFEF